jgi:acetyltransferase-like isoleucine patch superfamily enzyme
MKTCSLFDRVLFRIRNGNSLARLRTIWLRFCGAKIGSQTVLPKTAMTWPHQVQIGSQCVLEPDIFLKFDGIWYPGPAIVIGDGVFIGRGCEFNIKKRITIGKGSAIASGCKFIDHDHGITGIRIEETPGAEAEIMIGDYVWLGCNVIVLKGVTIGSSAVVGAGAVVTKNIPSGEIWAGIPARKVSSRAERVGTKSSST